MSAKVQMSLAARKRLQKSFFNELGPAGTVLRDMFYNLPPNVAFNMKDSECRIMAMNHRNCEICNIKDEWDAIGFRSDELFPATYAKNYMALDRQVLATGKALLGRTTQYPADRSMNVSITNIYPLLNADGKVIGTARSFYLSPDANATERYGRVHAISTYITEHYAEDLSIAQLASMASLPISAFKQAFAKVFSMTPGRYLITIRLNAVRRLLETTDERISEIALKTGFFDQSHLTRIFKKVRNMTPGEYRRKHHRAFVTRI